MFPSRLLLCCLLGSAFLVYGQQTNLSELICSATIAFTVIILQTRLDIINTILQIYMLYTGVIQIYQYRFGTRASIIVYYCHTARLASSNEPDGTDHTGEIISFSDVGSGVSTDLRAWYCYTEVTGGALWQGPGGSTLPIIRDRDAVGDELFISGVGNPGNIVLHRGPSHFSPDGEHCCVRINTDDRRCVTFSEC